MKVSPAQGCGIATNRLCGLDQEACSLQSTCLHLGESFKMKERSLFSTLDSVPYLLPGLLALR